MKKNINIGKNASRILALFGLPMLLVSCGSYYNASYYDDGIYGERPVRYVERNETPRQVQNHPEVNQYREFFNEKAVRYDFDVNDNNILFTDIDSYNSEDYAVENPNTQSYAGWGDNSTQVSINIYDNSPYWGWNTFYGGYYPYSRWGGYYGYPYYRNRISWGFGWSWGSSWGAYYDPYWGYGHPYYGGYYPYYGGGYYGYYPSRYYNSRNYAYVNGRRGGDRTYSNNRSGYYTNSQGVRTTGRPGYSTSSNNQRTYGTGRTYDRNSNGTYTPSNRRTYSNANTTTNRNYNNSSNSPSQRTYSPRSSSSRTYTPSNNDSSSRRTYDSGSSSSRSSNYSSGSSNSSRNYSSGSSSSSRSSGSSSSGRNYSRRGN